METPISEVADKFTVALIKLREGLPTEKIVEDYRRVLAKSKVSEEIVDELYEINYKMWRLEELITEEVALDKIGAYYLALRWMSHKRTEKKNEIADKYGGHREYKRY